MLQIRRVLPVAILAALVASAAQGEGELGAVEPSVEEQFGIWSLSKARSDPPAYGRKIGVDLDLVVKQPPLAVNRLLTGSARFHSKEMLDNDYFGHTSTVTGDGPNQMAADNGYDVFGAGLDNQWTTVNTIESIAKGFNLIPTFDSALALLIEDKNVQGVGHRRHLLALHAQWEAHREVGFGRAAKGLTYVYTIHTANVSVDDRFLTGVVFADANGSGRFDKLEGMGGVTVDAGGGFTTTSMAVGGWTIKVPQGTYTVTCSGGNFVGTATNTVTVGASNREIDFRSGAPKGEVDFGGVAGPAVAITASVDTGTAPLSVDFTATSSGQGTAFAWDFGDGDTSTSAAPSHVFQAPGLYTVTLRGTDESGTGGALVVVSVDGAAGAGAGTTPPASLVLTARKFTAKAGFAAPDTSNVKFTGVIEMPGGWTPGLSDAVVDVAGVRLAFALGDTDSVTDAEGNKFALKYKAASPLAAGVLAKVNVTLVGDFAAVLADAGLRDATEKRTLTDVPVAVILGELSWRGTLKLAVKSKAGVKSSAVLTK